MRILPSLSSLSSAAAAFALGFSLYLGAASSGYSQTPAAPANPAAGTPAVSAAPAIEPSRYVAPEDIPAHIEKISAILAMAKRPIDPFGRFQDPNYRPPQVEIAKPDAVDPNAGRAPVVKLTDLVSAIQVTMWLPAKQSFYVGDRAFHQGDRFPLRAPGGALVNVEILSVTGNVIMFRDTTTGEVATLRRGGLPPGMQRGNNIPLPPGVTKPNPAAPLDLQPNEVPPPSR